MWLLLVFIAGCTTKGLDGPALLHPEWVRPHVPFEIEIDEPVEGATYTYWWSLDHTYRDEFTGPVVTQTNSDPEEGFWRVMVQLELDGTVSAPSSAAIEIRAADSDEEPPEDEKPESQDSDGDGIPVFSDCDDDDAENTTLKGSSESCPVFDCAAVASVHEFIERSPETGAYWMKCETDGVSVYQMLCDFDATDGPWGLVLTTDGVSPAMTNTADSWEMPDADSELFTTAPLVRLGNTETVETQVSYGAVNIPVNALRFCVLNEDPVCVSTLFDAGSTLWGAASGEGELFSTAGEVFLDEDVERAVLGETSGFMGFWKVQDEEIYPRIGFQGIDLGDVIAEFGVGFAQGAVSEPDSDSTSAMHATEGCTAGLVTRPRGGDDGHYCHPVSIWLK
ncbi:MAG: hypothetical protein CL930_01415 [Deltaproteobacteria bacterium]|nr:hypothetical protein [Deltaproteobacteria bacterium]|tara:strand:+ start:165 stop:1343 length:1179 start_codon:yes stop_codon:yes gene_type:complete